MFTVSLLKYWAQEYADKLAELLHSQLTRSSGTPKRKGHRYTFVFVIFGDVSVVKMRPIYIGVSQKSYGKIVTTQLRCGAKCFHRLM